MKTSILKIAFLMFLTSPFAARAGETCRLLPTWHSVPESARSTLAQGMGSIAERGEAFQSTDALSGDDTPRNRFFGACVQGNRLVVAIERGGIGYALEVTEFVGGKKIREWYHTLPSGPFTPAFAVPLSKR